MAPPSYIHCPYCGQKALPIATQCPRCGRPFETEFAQRPAPGAGAGAGAGARSRRISLGLFIAGVAGIVIVVNALRNAPTITVGSKPENQPPAAAVESTTAPGVPAREPLPASSDTVPPPAAPRESRPVSPAPAAEPVGSGSAEVRYATTWVNVRAARSPSAPVIRVLRPGDTVTVDSLRQGWYRAETDGKLLGYVFRELVDTAPPTTSP